MGARAHSDCPTGFTLVGPDVTCMAGALSRTQYCQVHSYSWLANPSWSACSVTCGIGGTQTRSVQCIDTTINVNVSAAYCPYRHQASLDSGLRCCVHEHLPRHAGGAWLRRLQLLQDHADLQPARCDGGHRLVAADRHSGGQHFDGQLHRWPARDRAAPPRRRARTVRVTSQSNATRDYTLDILRAPSSVATLSAIQLVTSTVPGGYPLPGFSSGLYLYNLVLTNSDASLTLNPTRTNTYATIDQFTPSQTLNPLAIWPAMNVMTIRVRAQDGTTLSTYTINVRRNPSSSALLTSLTIVTDTTSRLSPAFATGTSTYKMSSSFGPTVSSFELVVVRANPDTVVTWQLDSSTHNTTLPASGREYIPLPEGPTTLLVTTTSQDGANSYPYTISLYKTSSDSRLIYFNHTAGVLSPAWSPATTTYTLTLNASDSVVTVIPTPASLTSTRTWSFAGSSSVGYISEIPSLQVPFAGDHELVVTVRSENLASTTVYRITIHRKSNDATLGSLVAQQGSFTKAFVSGVTSHDLVLPAGMTTLELTPTTSYSLAKVYMSLAASPVTYSMVTNGARYTAHSNVPFGDSSVSIRVVSEDGQAESITTVNVHRLSNVGTLADFLGLSAGSVSIVSFTYTYSLSLNATISTLSVTPTTTYGLAKMTYSFRQGPLTPIATGSHPSAACRCSMGSTRWRSTWSARTAPCRTPTPSISTATSRMPLCRCCLCARPPLLRRLSTCRRAFAPGTPDYKAVVATEVTSFVATSSSTVAGAKHGYALTTNSNPATASYVTFSLTQNQQTPTLSLSSVGTWYLHYQVVSEGSASVTATLTSYYTVQIRRLSSQSGLMTMSLANPSLLLSPSFGASTLSYTATVPAGTTSIDVLFQRQYDASTASYVLNAGAVTAIAAPNPVTLAGLPLQVGVNTLAITVVSEDATSRTTYTITLNLRSRDSTLRALSVDVGDLSPAFAPLNQTYSVKAQSTRTNVLVRATPTYPLSLLHYSTDGSTFVVLPAGATGVTLPLPVRGDNTIRVRVTAEDLSTRMYIIVVRLLSSDAQLTQLTTSPNYQSRSPVSWSPAITSYTVTLPSTASTVTLTFTQSNPSSKMSYTLAKSASTGSDRHRHHHDCGQGHRHWPGRPYWRQCGARALRERGLLLRHRLPGQPAPRQLLHHAVGPVPALRHPVAAVQFRAGRSTR